MKKGIKRGQLIKDFILKNIEKYPRDIISYTSKHFSISRQGVYRYMKELLHDGYVIAKGNTRNRAYALPVLYKDIFTISLEGLEEDRLWRERMAEVFKDVQKNVFDIWNYAFSEMVNNAIDHSRGRELMIGVTINGFSSRVVVHDDGVGIFRKIKKECNLEDERHAILELAKGKLTTDPESHTGEGIFFTSRMVDNFAILSGEVYFSHEYGKEEDWILENDFPKVGTSVFMDLANNSSRNSKNVFDEFASEKEDYGLTKTVVPVRLVRHGVENLVSRSQAKRLLARVDRFKTVILDFQGVDEIGRAFADEIFRVFKNNHPGILLVPVHTSEHIDKIIALAKNKKPWGQVVLTRV